MLDGAATDHDHTLTQPRYFGNIAFHSFNYDGSRHSVQDLPVTLAMRVSVIPKQAGRMVARNANPVAQRLARLGQHCQHVILRGIRRDAEPVKMQVRHVHAGVDRT